MIKCDPCGELDDGTMLEVGKIYEARIIGNKKLKFYRAVKNGILFSMWVVTKNGDRCGGYELPCHLEFKV